MFAQAILFEATVPLFVPFYVCLAAYDRRYKQAALVGGILGAITLGLGHLLLIVIQLVFYKLLRRVKVLSEKPFLVLFISIAVTQISWQLVFYAFEVPMIVQLYAGYEIVASMVMYMFFRQALVEPKEMLTNWRYERVIAVLIAFSMVLIALQRVQLFNISPATVLLQLAICCAAFYGPMAFATFVATVVSVVVSMSQLSFSGMIALYALTGALVGNAKKLGKYGIACLSLVPSVVFLFYDETLPLDLVHFTSISLGALLFLQVVKIIPVSKPQQQEKTDVVEQSVHDFQRFTVFLHEMVELSQAQNQRQKVELRDFAVCKSCFRYDRCWSNNFMELKLKEVLVAKQRASQAAQLKAEQEVQSACIRSPHLLNELQHRIMQFNMLNQQYYSRKVIGDQLKEMSTHFQNLLQQGSVQGQERSSVENQLRNKLAPLQCIRVQIEKLRFGYVRGTISVVEEIDEQQLSRTLTQFFKEHIELYEKSEEKAGISSVKYSFRSAIRYQMEYDIYNKTNAEMSGDYVVVTEVERGLHALLVADGMGTGSVARQQSKQLLFLLRQCLQYQLSAQLALSTLQYLLNPLTQDSYATLDMLLLDLKNGELVIWKTGSMATYIVRGNQLMALESRHAPLGTLNDTTVAQKMQLLAGDFVFILTDGIFESAHYEEQEQYLKDLLVQKTQHDWSLATLLYEVMESYKARFPVDDDVTFVATKIEHIQERWATVSL